MTENEAFKLVDKMVISRKCEIIKTLELKAVILNALEETQQYRAIGTVEEFKKCKEELELYRNLDKTNYHDGYRSAIDDVVCKISDYKEKHYHNREKYPINYGLLCDMENWFLDMKGE